jgi:uncharacterized repeat protein (TIGR01451 family)
MLQAVSHSCAARRALGRVILALLVCLGIDVAIAQQQGPVTGANVNVVSGTGADGDWTLQRQNEPTIACSSRNPRHCLAGANDYRTVDIPFPTSGERITGDAWLGWYTTKDGGDSWRTRLLPGYPQDTSAIGLASPLKGYPAGADPVVRSGTNGLFYYAGLVFDREEDGGSAIFVARFIDNNNQEGTAGEPIDYIGASIVQRLGPVPITVARRGQRGGTRPPTRTARPDTRAARVRAGVEQVAGNVQLVDKPWIAVDVPRAGAQMCSIGGTAGIPAQTFAGGRVYIAYTLFDGPGEERGRIMFTSSADCGATWAPPRVISRVQSADVNDDGVANSADLTRVQASYNRTCGQTGYNRNADVNNDCRVDVLDLTIVGRGVGQPVPPQPRLSQGATLAVDPETGALQIAWRQFNDGVLGDAIVTVRAAAGGTNMTPPRVVSAITPFDQGTSSTSFRTNGFPTLAFDAASRAYLAWSSRGYAGRVTPPSDDDARVVIATSTNGTTWTAPRQVDVNDQPGHQIMPALSFAQGKLQLIYYDLREDYSQLFQRFVDELPILNGAPPRVRHTIDVRAAQANPAAEPLFVSTRLTQYQVGGAPGTQTVQQLEFNPPNLPLFRAGTTPFMGDYVDVAPSAPFVRNGSTWTFNTAASGNPVFHGIWTDNRDIRPPANGVWTDYTPPNPPFPRPLTSAFDPTQAVPACVPGQAGMRNQNIYTARITTGLVVGALGNTRRLSAVQRTFPVFAQNNSTTIRSYRLTIANQPPGGQASFQQFGMLTSLDVQVPRRSTIARTVFVRSSDARAQVNVSVVEIATPGGAVVPNGQLGTIVLNPDPTNPDLENPDLENPDLENPDLENAEVHNPDLENATVRNPDLENPDLENPAIVNPDLENTRVANPSILNPDLENPDLENPDLENPDLENPDLENADLVNGALSDTTWTITNKGNTAASFTVKLGLNRQLPLGFRSQLIAHKVYQTPTVLGCSLLKQTQTVLLANIPNPRYVTAAQFANPDLENPDLENLTVALAPGETARITLRVFDPDRNDAITFRAADSVTPVAVAQAVGTIQAQQGVTQPAVAAVLTPGAPVPGSTAGGTYTTTLASSVPGTWTIVGGALPPGVTLNPTTGVVTGTTTTAGTYTFTARFQTATGLTDYRTVTVTVGGAGASADVGVSGSATIETGGSILYTLTVSNAGPAVATNVVLTDTLPEGTTFVSASTALGTCRHANGTLQCSLGTLASGGTVAVHLRVQPRTAGTHVNRASVATTIADPNAANDVVDTPSVAGPVTPCTTVCFSGPSSFIAGPHDADFGGLTGDFNEDGHPDIALGPIDINTLAIMLGNGSGGFGPATPIVLPGSPEGADIADFNNDGHLDIVVTSPGVAQAWLLLGNGLGGFAAPITITLPFAAENPAAADFNRDGNADIAFASSDNGSPLAILHGNGNGTFQGPVTIGTVADVRSVVTDDFNRDGNPDLALHSTDMVAILFGSGAAGFQPPVTLTVTGASAVLKTGDLTGDTYPDLFVGTAVSLGGTGGVLLAASNGSGGFNAPVPVTLNVNEIDESVAFADFDSDGDVDVVWNRVGGGVGIQLNNGTGVFAAPIYLAMTLGGAVIPGDFNGDGRPDLAVTAGRTVQSQVLVFLNTCDRPPADLAVTLAGPAGTPVEGNGFSYTIGVTNNGPNAATGVQLNFAFGSAAEFVAIGGGAGSCTVDRSNVTCQLGTLASGASLSFDVVVRSRMGVNLPSLAGVTATTGDPNPANNTAFLTTLLVTNTNESGPGSLWQALADANDIGPRDTIAFNIPGTGVHTIVASRRRDLPQINAPIVIDGTTQPGYAGVPLIEISGAPGNSTNGLFLNAGNSIVRGLAINGFDLNGIHVNAGTPGGNLFEANAIGTNAAGTVAIQNQGYGIALNAPNNTIGGVAPAAGNLLSGNGLSGVGIFSTDNTLLRNAIGTDITQTSPLGNALQGVFIQGSNNHVGSFATGVGNIIAFNGVAGVHVNSGTGNEIVSNAIYSNGALGIDLAPPGVNPNDAGDTDTGANNRINTPVLSSARTVGADTLVQVGLNPNPSGPFQVHFYASPVCDASGSGEGQNGLGVSSFGAGPGGGITNFEVSFPTALAPPGTFVTATATDSAGNTSEFSVCALVAADAGTANLSIIMVDTPDPVTVGSELTYSIGVQNLGPNASSNATVTDVLPAGVTLVSANASIGSCSGTTTITCTLGSIANGALVTISIVVTPTTAATVQNTVTVSAAGTDPDLTNNSRSSTTVVQAAAPSSFIVTNTTDSGVGSLRQAILAANATPGAEVISFNIPGAGVHTISPASALPVSTGPVTIDGTTQPGFSGTPLIELDGTSAGGANGLALAGGTSTVRGLVINRFQAAGIVLSSGGNVVEGSHIGTNPDASAALPNAGSGILVTGAINRIGGTTAAARNVISGNGAHGIQIAGAAADGNQVLGNYIGTDRTGSSAVANTLAGIDVAGGASGTVVGGAAGGAGNLLSGNLWDGVRVRQTGTDDTVIQGNLIGTDATGLSAVPNGTYGVLVFVDEPHDTTIGGPTPAARNVISGNAWGGVAVFGTAGTGPAGTSIQGNFIGTTIAGDAPLPNLQGGVGIFEASNNTVGGTAAGSGNVIAFNGGPGIVVSVGEQNRIRRNSVFANVGPGIDFDNNGVTPNDAGDADTGSNTLQNFPVLTATTNGVQGTLNSTPNSEFLIEFFGNAVCDATGNGEGATFLGTASVLTDGAGNGAIPLFAATAGQIVTATATNGTNNTSEFSACVTVPADTSIALTATDASAAELGGDSGTIVVTRNGPTTAARDVEVTVSGTAAGDGTDYTITSPFLSGPVFPAVFTLHFPAGAASTTVTITPIFGPSVEGTETVVLSVDGSTASVTIADEPPVTLTATDAAAAELGGDTATVTVTRTGPTTYQRDVEISVSGTASGDGTDYTISSPLLLGAVSPGSFTLRFAAGQTSTTVTIAPIFSPTVEGSETVVLSAEGSTAIVTIADEPGITLNATDGLAAEAGPDPATVVVTRTGATTFERDVVINLSGTASGDGTDYTIASPFLLGAVNPTFFTLRFPAGQSTTTVTITPVADAFVEAPETLTLSAEGATASVTIVDQFAPTTYTVTTTNDGGAGSLRQAILDANGHPGHDLIAFAIPGTGVRTIFTAGLPVVTESITIDATTQPGFSGTPLIVLTGVEAPLAANGLVLNGGESLVRGLIINRFGGSGIVLQGGDSNVVSGNWIGLSPTGTGAAANGNGITIDSSGNTIGGVTSATRNVISGNTGSGVAIRNPAALSNGIIGNYIGTDVAGTADVGNGIGVSIDGEANFVGTPFAPALNVVSGNDVAGVLLRNGASANAIQNNLIGTDASGVNPLPNLVGVSVGNLTSGASTNTIGGVFAGAGNVIAFNTTAGVAVYPSSSDNAITGNAISGNGGLGIDLNANGVSANDATDADEGGNNQQNFPVLAAASGGVEGTLTSTPFGLFRIEFFANAACDASGHGEGATFLGATSVLTDAAGVAEIPFFAVASGQNVTATATDGSNNTSEFSTCVTSASNARTWISNTSGFWEDPANWSDGIVPVDGDVVVIDRLAANPVVTVQSATVTLAALRSEELLVVAGGSIGFTGTANVNGGLTMSGGLLTGSGNIELRGITQWTGGQIAGTGGLIVAAGAQLLVESPGQPGVLARPLTNNGLVTWNQASLSLVGGGQIVNAAGGIFNIQSNLSITNNTGGPASFVNAGTLFKTGAGGTISFDGVAFATSGAIQLRLGPVSDRIASTAPGTLSGLLDVALQPGFVPALGSQYDVLAFSSRSGAFDLINGNGQNYSPSYTATGLTLTTAAVQIANLAISKSDSPDPASIDSPLTYTVTVTNAGPDEASAVSVADALPAASTFVSATPSQGSCTGTTALSCALGNLASGASATITIVVTPTAAGILGNTAVVTSATQDNEPGNNIASTTTTVTAPGETFLVTTTANSGAGSLRQAILDANASTGTADRIHFNIPAAGVQTIAPTSFLPTITDPVTIDATTQPGTTTAPLIFLDGINAGPLANGLFLTAGNSTIRGLAIGRFGSGGLPGDLGGAGIVIQGPGNNALLGNYLGLAADGLTARPNRADGVFVDNSPNNQIGDGPTGNVISGNTRYGVMLNGAGTTGTIVRGNVVGPSRALGPPLAGAQLGGIAIFGASGTTIGGPLVLDRNAIFFNTGNGIHVASGTNNTITRNQITNNGQLGINLGPAGVTANDPGDADAGANDLVNFPVLTPVAGGVTGTYNGVANATYTIELFSNGACAASGNGEGGTFISAVAIVTDGSGNAVIPFIAAPINQQITATTTDADGNTSEFSACVLVSPAIALSLPDTLPIGVGRTVTATVMLSSPAPSGGTIVGVTSDAPTIASIAAPGTVTIAQGAMTATIDVSGVNVGSTTLRATATNYLAGELGITVTQNLISTPATLGVALGQTAQLPVGIGPSPAPPGGLTLDIVSDNPAVIEVLTPQITIPTGALAANATVRGLAGGTANVTASNPQYSPSTTSVTSSAQLNVLEPSATFNSGLPAPTLTVRLEHNGTPVAALSSLVVSLASANPACVAVPASTTIAAGLVSNTFQPSYGGTASLPCTANVTVSANGITPDSIPVTVNPAATFTPGGSVIVGSSLSTSAYFMIDTSAHGGLDVTITSQNPALVLVAATPNAAGAASISTTLPVGQTFVTYYVHALENLTGAATVTASATGVNSGTQTIDVVQGGVEIANLATATTTLSSDDVGVYVQVGLPCPGANAVVCTVQNVRPGRPPLVVTLSVSAGPTTVVQLKSDEPGATGQTVTKPIQAGIYYSQPIAVGTIHGLAVDPIAAGTRTITASAPGLLTMTTTGAQAITVSAPGITPPAMQMVGGGLQIQTAAQLGADQHGGVLVTVQSDDPSRVLVSPDAATAGTASFTRTIPNGQTAVSYFVQGLENLTGSANVSISAPGFTAASHGVQVVTAGIEIANLDATMTTLSPNDIDWYVQVGLPCSGGTLVLCQVQSLRAGGPAFVATLSLAPSDPVIAQLSSDQPLATGQTVTKPIGVGTYYTQAVLTNTVYGLTFDPISPGSTTVTVTGPPGFTTMSVSGVRPVAINGPTITPSLSTVTVGAGLTTPASAFLDASQHGGITVTVTSSDPSRVRLSPDLTTPGTTSINVNVPNGSASVFYYVQGLENLTGSATISLTATGFASAQHSVQVVTAGIEFHNLDTPTTSMSADDVDWYVQVGLPCPGNAQLCQAQSVRAGGPAFIASLTNSVDTVARLRSDEPVAVGQAVSKPIQAGFYYTQALLAGTVYGLTFDPIANGVTTVTVAGPPGVVTMSNTGVRTVTVTTPTIQLSVPNPMIGSGLQVGASAFLSATQHGGVIVTATSSQPALVRVSTDAQVAGSGSVQVTLANNDGFVPLVLQALENVTGTATVTLTAPGFTTASMTVSVRPSGIEVHGLPASIDAAAPDAMGWYVMTGLPNDDNTFLTQPQTVRAGSPGYVITLTSNVPSAAQLGSDEPEATGPVVTKPIAVGSYYTLPLPASPSYGLRFDPIGPGSTTVTATGIPGVISLPLATRTVIINP